jgi:hypothetical protein
MPKAVLLDNRYCANISVNTRPKAPLGVSTRRMVASVGAMFLAKNYLV